MTKKTVVLRGVLFDGFDGAGKYQQLFFYSGFLFLSAIIYLVLFSSFRSFSFVLSATFIVICPFALSFYFRPVCVIQDADVFVRRGRRTLFSSHIEELTIIGKCYGKKEPPQLFLCSASSKAQKRFMLAHEQEKRIIAEKYGYNTESLTDNEQKRIMATLYLWQKANVRNPNTSVIRLTKRAWEKLETYCQTYHLTLLELLVPQDRVGNASRS